MKNEIVISILLIFLLFSPVAGYEVSGYIKLPDGSAIRNANIVNNITSDTAITDSSGFYSLSLPNNTYQIIASKEGYTTNSTVITVLGADVSNVNITLDTLYSDYELAYRMLLAEQGDITLWIFLVLLILDFVLILFFFTNTRNRIYGNIVIGLFSVFLSFILAHRALLYPIEMPDVALLLNGIAIVMVAYVVMLVIEVVIERIRGAVQ